MARIEGKLFTNADLWCPQRVPPIRGERFPRYRSLSTPTMQPGFAAPQPQLASFVVREKALPLPVFMKQQLRLLQSRRRHRPIYHHGDELIWSQGRLMFARVQDGHTRELTEEELQLLRKTEAPITGYRDGKNALENCEKLLASLEPEPTLETKLDAPKTTHRMLPKGASGARQPGAKRRWFPEGNIVAMRQTEVDFILAAVHGEPIAFESKDRARRRYGRRRLTRHELKPDHLIIARVIKRFRVEIRCSSEFQHFELDKRVGYSWPEMKVIYLPKLCLLKDGTEDVRVRVRFDRGLNLLV